MYQVFPSSDRHADEADGTPTTGENPPVPKDQPTIEAPLDLLAGPEPALDEDEVQIYRHGRRTDAEPLSNLPVREASCHEPDDLLLPRSQRPVILGGTEAILEPPDGSPDLRTSSIVSSKSSQAFSSLVSQPNNVRSRQSMSE